MKFAFYSLIVMMLPMLAHAELTTRTDVVQRGVYREKGCVHDESDFANNCKCKSDVRRLVVTDGLPKDVKARVNALLVKESGVIPKEQTEGNADFCYGYQASAKREENISTIDRKTSLTYQDADVLTFTTAWYEYGAGAAHGNYGNSIIMVNAKTGQLFNVLSAISEKQLKALDVSIKKALRTEYAKDVFDEELTRTKPYVTAKGCDGCNIYYSGNGWEVEFGLYSVAPYSSGMVTVNVPESVLPSPHTLITGNRYVSR